MRHRQTQEPLCSAGVACATHYSAWPNEASRLFCFHVLQAQDERPLLGCDRLHRQAASGEQRHARQRAVRVRLELLQRDAPPQLAHLGQHRAPVFEHMSTTTQTRGMVTGPQARLFQRAALACTDTRTPQQRWHRSINWHQSITLCAQTANVERDRRCMVTRVRCYSSRRGCKVHVCPTRSAAAGQREVSRHAYQAHVHGRPARLAVRGGLRVEALVGLI